MGKSTGKKGEVSSLSSADKKVLEYMCSTNRPYSANDVFMNLRQEIGKAQIIKILTSLADSGKLLCKTYGKQQVFVSNQELLEKPSQEELDDLDKQMQEMQETLSQMKDKNHQLTLEFNLLNATLPDEEIKKRLTVLATETLKNEEKLTRLRTGSVLISESEKKKIHKQHELMNKEWKKRKRMFHDIINTITESAEIKPKALMDELGLEGEA